MKLVYIDNTLHYIFYLVYCIFLIVYYSQKMRHQNGITAYESL